MLDLRRNLYETLLYHLHILQVRDLIVAPLDELQ